MNLYLSAPKQEDDNIIFKDRRILYIIVHTRILLRVKGEAAGIIGVKKNTLGKVKW